MGRLRKARQRLSEAIKIWQATKDYSSEELAKWNVVRRRWKEMVKERRKKKR